MSDEKIATGRPVSTTTAKTALIVGEDHAIQAALAAILTPEGWSLEESPDLADAFTKATAKCYGLIVTSRTTSGKEDVEFLRKIRRLRPGARVVILTADSTPEDVIASMREHAFGYL